MKPTTLVTELATVYRGPVAAIELLVIAWLARGHALVEDIPGVGKTTLARAFAAATGGTFRRLQCTPDLMPSDVTGVSIWDEHERRFRFHPGPVFTEVLLADELNRTPPRTQAALLEALSENQVTIEGEAKALPSRFFCIATQNPHDQVGTYPLPDSQRDRFLVCSSLGYPATEAEFDEFEAHEPVVDMPELERVYILTTSNAMTYRIIYMDGREHPKNLTPSYFGHSVGHWDGDTLVVDSVGYNDVSWQNRDGLPTTDKLHLIERFTRTDMNTLDYKVTIDDPGAYTRPWTSSWDLHWVAGQELPEFYCQDNRQ